MNKLFTLGVLCILLGLSLSQDLIAHYTFEEEPTGTPYPFFDQSSNFYHGTVRTGIASRSRSIGGNVFNKAILFTSQNVQTEPLIIFPDMSLSRSELTLSFLFETRDTYGQMVFSLNFSNNKTISAYIQNDFMYLNFFDETTVDLDYNFESRALYHLVFVLTSNRLVFYVNAVEIQMIDSQRNYNFGQTFNLRLGYSSIRSSFCTSLFDDVTIWNNVIGYDQVWDLLDKYAFGQIPTCNNFTSIQGPLFDICNGNDTNGAGNNQVQACGWGSPYRSKGVSCSSSVNNEIRLITASDPYFFRYLSIPRGASYMRATFRFLDLCGVLDPNEDMNDLKGSCRRSGKYMIASICAFNNYCVNVGIETYAQRFFHTEGYSLGSIDDLIEFGKISRPMYQSFPQGPLIQIEIYSDNTLWIFAGKDEADLIGYVQGYRLNIPFPFEYLNLLRVTTISSYGELGAVFSDFSFISENYFIEPEGCPEYYFFNGYDCQSCGPNSWSPKGSISEESCICEPGHFADNCRSSPLCLGTEPGFSFNTFDSSQILFLGDSRLNSGKAEITPALNNKGGAVFFGKPWPTVDSADDFKDISFKTHFIFLISNNGGVSVDPGADGMAFVISSALPSNDFTLSLGGGLGYKGLRKSIAIEFDTYQNTEVNDPPRNHVGLDIDGNVWSTLAVEVGQNLKNGNLWHCWVEYDATYSILTVKLNGNSSIEPETPLLQYSLKISQSVGPEMYIGFTAGTGGYHSAHSVVKWDWKMTPQINCVPCLSDTYKSFFGNDICTYCPLASTTFSKEGASDINECECYPGLYMDFGYCNECPVNTTSNFGQTECTPCPEHSSTLGYTGQSMCYCQLGYVMDFDGHCKDYNECESSQACNNGGTCINFDGTYKCKCSPGYRGDYCEYDINECVTLGDPCLNGGTCYNTPGSYECSCPPGWMGYSCLYDIDECLVYPNICHPKATCRNNPGSFACVCKDGLVGNGIECNELKGPTLSLSGVFARVITIKWVNENYYNATSYILEIDYTEQLDSPFATDEERKFSTAIQEYIVDKLPPYTFMKMRLRAVSGTVISPSSNEIQFRTLATNPDPPVLSIKQLNDGFSLLAKWIPGKPNGATATAYTVMWVENDIYNTTISETVPITQTWFEINNLVPGKNYTIVVVTQSEYGPSSPSPAIVTSVGGVVIVDPSVSPTIVPEPSKKSNAGMIAGVVVGVLVLVAIVVAGGIYYKKSIQYGRIQLPDKNQSRPGIGLLNPIDDSLNVPDAFGGDEEDAVEK